MQYFLKQLFNNLDKFANATAFHIEGQVYTYQDLGCRIAPIQKRISEYDNQQYFAVVSRNHIDTYAAIFALWLSGKTSVPLSAANPMHRNRYIIEQTGVKTIFDASIEILEIEDSTTISTINIDGGNLKPHFSETDLDTDLYLLFTSGSTGLPKGVRISRNNVQAYFEALEDCHYAIDHRDRFLNIYELTFDASVQCYVWPIVLGAAVYTIPSGGMKFLMMIKTLQDHHISVVKMTPSAIFYLQKYFSQINLPHLRYSLFGAEALPAKLIEKWGNCVLNAEIHNVYGPTEATVNCTFYKWTRNGENRILNGIISIGKTYLGTKAIVCDQKLNQQPAGAKGELCLSGAQITKGYWQNDVLNNSSFFNLKLDGATHRFYRTGDLAIIYPDGNIMFLGRIDSQVQIDGHRIELGEIEHYAYQFSSKKSVALAIQHDEISNGIALFIESEEISEDALFEYLRKSLPEYMIPSQVFFLKEIPLLISGKTDRVKLFNLLK